MSASPGGSRYPTVKDSSPIAIKGMVVGTNVLKHSVYLDTVGVSAGSL